MARTLLDYFGSAPTKPQVKETPMVQAPASAPPTPKPEVLVNPKKRERQPYPPVAPANLPPSYFVSASYDGHQKKAVVKLYEPQSGNIYFWYDNTGHKPYLLTNLSEYELAKLDRVVNHEGFDHFETVDKYINTVLAPKKIGEYNLGIQAFLRLYVYQTHIPKNWGKVNLKEAESIASLGRAILGWQVMREVEPFLGFLLTQKLTSIMDNASETEKVALQTFHPTWFVEYCTKMFGQAEAMAFLEGSMKTPPNYIRVNTIKATEETVIEKLTSEGVELQKATPLQYTYRVASTKKPLNQLPSYSEGLFYTQDKASCFATQAAQPKPGDTVFDICAAPGAKTTFLDQLMQNQGNIYSVDFSSKRILTWKKEIKRMGAEIAEPLVVDARVSVPLVGEADLVVLDPPCTSTGVFAKQPSAKWRLSPNSIKNMSELQTQIINNCADKVKPGGYLTYSTCSITLEENEGVVEQFLKAHPDFGLVEVEPKIGLPGLNGLSQCQRLYPHIHQCNGFFIAKLQRLK